MEKSYKYSEDEKKNILRNLREQRDNSLILHRPSLIRLVKHLGTCLENTACDHTFRFTAEWIDSNPSADIKDEILENFRQNGMACDCQVLYKCYDKFCI